MPLELAKEKITLKQQKGEQTSQVLLEGDVIIPDSKPDVKEVLYSQGRVRLDEVKTGEEKITFSGELSLWILYRPAEGERPVYAVTSSLPLQDLLHMEGVHKEDAVEVTAKLEHLECDMINDRKIGVRAVVRITAQSQSQTEMEVLKDVSGEGVQLYREKIKADLPVTEKKDRFVVKDEWVLPEDKPEIGEILMEHVDVVQEEIRPLEGKISVRGVLPVTVVYSGAGDGMPQGMEKAIPFAGFVETPLASADRDAQVQLSLLDWEIRPQVNEDGESRILSVSATVGADVTLTEEKEEEWVTDAYVPGKEMTLHTEKIILPQSVGRSENEFVQKETIRLEEGEAPMLQAVAVWGDVHLGDVTAQEDVLEAEGTLDVEILYDCIQDEEPVCVLHRTFPFHRSVEMKGVLPEDQIRGRASLREIDFRLASEGEGELRAQIALELQAQRMVERNTVTQMKAEEPAEAQCRPGAVIYTVQPGDSLWTIAKGYHTTVEQILAVNEIEHPQTIYPGQKLLILRACPM
ncbi:DUF3794 domain-containing protein [Anaerotignum lactatifermentans]|uniref:DUF3794 domain-containing protein n=1 Tax=Anaerotignum lactatifermentans TaxID=160404 RepID=A0ABS2GBV8_9FIRM|nr:SPOCS domain-containing protein [Anaerotignum lactatifermentans]MBM6830444.1 DUF3794 domain-containing protein [Anaerotignum lactatifermentans]MBM6878969.1 DUF3794 domain-containing protein [Anaerotignum lactatifermentans]MBM6952015.1 DUF3794 domain-containing protein [Anaerotignum lactatifermentans]